MTTSSNAGQTDTILTASWAYPSGALAERERVLLLVEEWLDACDCKRHTPAFIKCFALLCRQVRSGKKPWMPGRRAGAMPTKPARPPPSKRPARGGKKGT